MRLAENSQHSTAAVLVSSSYSPLRAVRVSLAIPDASRVAAQASVPHAHNLALPHRQVSDQLPLLLSLLITAPRDREAATGLHRDEPPVRTVLLRAGHNCVVVPARRPGGRLISFRRRSS